METLFVAILETLLVVIFCAYVYIYICVCVCMYNYI